MSSNSIVILPIAVTEKDFVTFAKNLSEGDVESFKSLIIKQLRELPVNETINVLEIACNYLSREISLQMESVVDRYLQD
jgi:hypothetical protein